MRGPAMTTTSRLRAAQLATLLGVLLILSGCTPALALFFSSVSALGTGVNVYQEYESRQAQKDQTAAIRDLWRIQKDQTIEVKALREEIRQFREQEAAARAQGQK